GRDASRRGGDRTGPRGGYPVAADEAGRHAGGLLDRTPIAFRGPNRGGHPSLAERPEGTRPGSRLGRAGRDSAGDRTWAVGRAHRGVGRLPPRRGRAALGPVVTAGAGSCPARTGPPGGGACGGPDRGVPARGPAGSLDRVGALRSATQRSPTCGATGLV